VLGNSNSRAATHWQAMDNSQCNANSPIAFRPCNSRMRMAALACVSLAAVACSGQELEQQNLGSTFVGQSSASAGDPNQRSSLIRDDGFIDPFIEGHWIGEAEDLFSAAGADGERPSYVFPSGSKQITLDLWLPDPTYPEGKIRFGAGEVPVPEPGVVYPPGLASRLANFPSFSSNQQLPPIEGFVYSLYEAVFRLAGDEGASASTLAMGYVPNAGYADWCALQPVHAEASGYSCLTLSGPDDPNALCGTTSAFGPDEHYDCNLSTLCRSYSVCECTEQGCIGASGPGVQLWLVRSGDDLVGNFVGGVFAYPGSMRFMPVGSVRLQRAAP
jgi:hypothetical protein